MQKVASQEKKLESRQEPQDCIFQLSPDAVSLPPPLPAMFSLLCHWFHRALHPSPAPSLRDFLYPEPTAGLPPLISKRNKPEKERAWLGAASVLVPGVCLPSAVGRGRMRAGALLLHWSEPGPNGEGEFGVEG